jgi:hypothetical protein
MDVRNIATTAALFLGWAFAQGGPGGTTEGKTVYFLKDSAHKQWCAYASESQLRTQVQSLRAMVVGGVDYVGGRVSAVHVTQSDETGDWAVNDDYSVDEAGKIQRLRRTINILPEDNSEEQVFLLASATPFLQSSTHRELRTGKPTQKTVGWFHAPPVVASLRAFPFAALIGGGRQDAWANGTACVPDDSQ